MIKPGLKVRQATGQIEQPRPARGCSGPACPHGDHERTCGELKARIKELSCLYGISEALALRESNLDEQLRKVVKAIPKGWQFPDQAWVLLKLDDKIIASGTVDKAGPRMKEIIRTPSHVGYLCVGYGSDFAVSVPQGPFLASEHELLRAVSRHIGRVVSARATEDLLRASEESFKTLFDGAGDALFVNSVEGRFLAVNEVACRRLGYTMEELLTMTPQDIDAPENAVNLPEIVAEIRATGSAVFRSEHIARDGTRIPVEINTRLIPYLGQQAALSIARDISGQIRAEQALQHRMQLERIVASASAALLNVEPEQIDSALNTILKAMGEFSGADRCYLFQFSKDGARTSNSHEWCAPGIQSAMAGQQNLETRDFPWSMARLSRFEGFRIDDRSELPDEASRERALLQATGAHSILLVPLRCGNRLAGFLGFASLSAGRRWRKDDQALLETLAALISAALERRRSHEEIKLHERFSRSIISSLSARIAVLDGSGTIVEVNEAWERFARESGLGWPGAASPGVSYLEVCHRAALAGDSLAGQTLEGIFEVMEGRSRLFTLEYPCHDGREQRWFLQQVTPMDASGVVISHVDITDRMRAEERLRESEARYRMLVENMQEGLIIADKNGCFTYVNDRFCKMLERECGEIVGRHITEFVEGKERETLKQQLLARAQGERGLYELAWTRSDGRNVFSTVSATPVFEGNKTFRGSVAIISDITERKFLSEQLYRAQKLESIGQLAAGIAHEINTPAQYVGNNVHFLEEGFADLLAVQTVLDELAQRARQERFAPDILDRLEAALREHDVPFLREEVPSAISQTREGIERISKIVKSVKQFAHPGQEAAAPVDINACVESTVTVATNEWKYVANMVLELDRDLPPVRCVASECNQVLLNLIVNAAHAIEDAIGKKPLEKGTITITTRREGDWIEIRLRDTGTGIPEAIRSRLFDPFFTTKAVGRGTGQGLAIAHTVIVEKHHGTVSFETEEGRGTTFIIRLPLHGKNGN